MIDEFLQEQAAFYVSGARGAIDRLCGGLRHHLLPREK
jgi:hypothetical protein